MTYATQPHHCTPVDVQYHARFPAALISAALQRRGLKDTDLSAIETELNITVRQAMPAADLTRVLARILGEDSPEAAPRLPHPSALPLSMEFVSSPDRAGVLLPAYPVEFSAALKNRVRERDNQTCRCCGLRKGDMYTNAAWDRYKRVRGPVKIMQLQKLQVAHPASAPEQIDEAELVSLCPRCHQRKDAVHNWSAKALTQAMSGQLTAAALAERLTHLTRVTGEAVTDGTRPLGALQPGGADLLAAVLADREMPFTAGSARLILPALENEPVDDIRLVLAAARERLRLRGLMMPSGFHLTRMLTCPQTEWPAQAQFLPRPGQEEEAA
ncbi:hypothetical protein [Deinococcus arenicola]|uniref:HNH endonuclease n=1 Tax=Deinococcus arenicola TaxID=2994950 RepID=A0ABU4DWJ3_9DEIO|nr:hypothetical protein [Deinococcus sp. ZS9-10]MDV6376424.1 hypothetical protein [Deinococcus sp. ZS9-10]